MHSPRKTTFYLTLLALLYLLANLPTMLDNNDGDGYFQMPLNRVISVAAEAKGTTLVYSGLDGDLHFYDYKNGGVDDTLAGTIENEVYPSFSPDGRWVVYAASAPNTEPTYLQLRSRDGMTTKILTRADGVSDSTPVFSPDGNTIAFVRASEVDGTQLLNLWVMERDGSNPHPLTYSGFRSLTAPVFTRDGRFLLVAAEASPTTSTQVLFRVPVDGSAPIVALDTPSTISADTTAWATMPAVSPDGRTIAYLSDRDHPARYDIVVGDIASNKETLLGVSDTGVLRHPPVFLEDGSLLFLGAGNILWRVQADGTGLEKLRGADLFNGARR